MKVLFEVKKLMIDGVSVRLSAYPIDVVSIKRFACTD